MIKVCRGFWLNNYETWYTDHVYTGEDITNTSRYASQTIQNI